MEDKKFNREKGRKGENLAVTYLETRGYKILDRNWIFEKIELDIIAEKDGIVVFVEVKARKNNDYGYPEEGVNVAKQENILEAAEEYLDAKDLDQEIRFDIISITGVAGHENIHHIMDAISPYDI